MPSYAPPLSGNSSIDAIIATQFNTTNPNPGTPYIVNYTFDTGFSAAQQQAIVAALAQFDAAANIRFVQAAQTASSSTDYETKQYDLVFIINQSLAQGNGSFYPNIRTLSNGEYAEGYVEFNPYDVSQTLTNGGHGLYLVLHETGHALGLKHAGNYNSFDYGPFLPSAQDNTNYTVMSYNGSDTGTLKAYDIAALQYLYGANGSVATISQSQTGTAAAERFVGTVDADVIAAGGGNDTVTAGAGADVIEAGDGNDYVQGAVGADTISGGLGNDTILGGKDGDTIYGGQGDDVINANNNTDSVHGNVGDDTIRGGQNEDYLYGDEGDDVLWGDKGSDIYTGGEGADTFVVRAFNDDTYFNELINDFDTSEDHLRIITTGSRDITDTNFSNGISTITFEGGFILTIYTTGDALSDSDITII